MRRLLLLAAALQGCLSGPVREYDPGPSSAGPVFLVHGLWPDHEGGWMDDAEEALQSRGIEALCVPYSAFFLEYLAGFGTDRPAGRIASFAREIEKRHAMTGCPATLRFRALGYSAGTVVLLKAAERGVRFERVYFAGCPLPFWTNMPEALGHIVNFASPLDGLLWIALGAGQLGLAAADENRLHGRPHLWPLFDDPDTIDEIIRELRPTDGPAHNCFGDPAYRAWYRGAKLKLRRG